MSRKTPDWIRTFVAYTTPIESPPRFRFWSAVATVSAALERRCFSTLIGRPTFANEYVILVSEPGVGKSYAIKEARRFMVKAGINVPADSITKEKLYNNMASKYTKTEMNGHGPVVQTPLCIVADEFGVFLKRQDYEYMNVLTKFWDSDETFDYETKGGGSDHIEGVCASLLAGCTPRWLADALPAAAYEQGFAARLFLVYDNKPVVYGLDRPPFDAALEAALHHDLEAIRSMRGEFRWEPEARAALNEWILAGMHPVVTDPRFASYNTRRPHHIQKLAMIFSASRREDMIVRMSDYESARDAMLDGESTAPVALEAAGKNDYIVIMAQAVKFITVQYARTKEPVPEYMIRRLLNRDVPPQYVAAVLNTMVDSHMILRELHAERPFYRPIILQ